MLALTFLAPATAFADELVVGALRDQDGRVVAGATVRAVDGAGNVLASDRSAANGTFAVASPGRAAAVVVVAPDAEPARFAVPADGSAIAGIVYRHRAADVIPTAADVAALPSGGPSELGGIIPYRVGFATAISDRWLSRGRGVTMIEGLPFYRRSDGSDITTLLPSHALGVYGVAGSLQAPWYGDRGSGGVLDAKIFDRTDTVRATSRDGQIAAGRDAAAFAASSWDGDGRRSLLAAHGAVALGPVGSQLVLMSGVTPNTRYAGAGTELRAATRTFDAGAHIALTRSDANTGGMRDAGSVSDLAFDVSGRGPNSIAVRARWRDERGVFGIADSEHRDAALVLGTSRGNVFRVTAAVAFTYGNEAGYELPTQSATAILPSLSLDAPLGGGWSFHAAGIGASLGTPGYAIARSSLAEASFAYSDGRRLRAEVVAYAEGDLAPTAVNRGAAVSLGWEIAPRVSLRAWSLRDGDVLFPSPSPYGGGPASLGANTMRTFDRDVVWLTWDAPMRVDLLLRSKKLEGNVRVPLGERYAITFGSYLARDGKRTATAGVVAHP